MELKLAKSCDAKRVYEIVQETVKEIYPKYYLREIVDMFCEFHNEENIMKDIEEGNTYILTTEDGVIGTGTINENHITRVYVLPRYQGRGCGTFIMKKLEKIISEKYDYSDIDASLPACKLYSKLGYKTIDHGMWECANGVIQVYEIMKKDFKKKSAEGLILRPYKPDDAKSIVKWIKDEVSFRKWCADRYENYPITPENINFKYIKCNGDCKEWDNFYPVTAVDENGPVGHLIMRYTNKEKTIIRMGFVIVDDSKRGMGYGKKMMQMAMGYAFDMLGAKKVTLGVFENNPSAYYCYKAAGFKEIPMENDSFYEMFGEKWKCIEMEAEG